MLTVLLENIKAWRSGSGISFTFFCSLAVIGYRKDDLQSEQQQQTMQSPAFAVGNGILFLLSITSCLSREDTAGFCAAHRYNGKYLFAGANDSPPFYLDTTVLALSRHEQRQSCAEAISASLHSVSEPRGFLVVPYSHHDVGLDSGTGASVFACRAVSGHGRLSHREVPHSWTERI